MQRVINKVKSILRKIILFIRRRFIEGISYCLLVLCCLLLLFATGANLIHKAPILSFIFEETGIPSKFRLKGIVHFYKNDNCIKKPVSITVGGFSTDCMSEEEFELVFAGYNYFNVPVIVTFTNDTSMETHIEHVSWTGDNIEYCEFSYYFEEK